MTLSELISSFETTPFLFVGSGMTRRYLNLPDWKGLLEYFARKVHDDDFAYSAYENRAKTFDCPQGVLPKVAELIQNDYNEAWYANPDIRTADAEVQEKIKNGLSPFKAEISAHIQKDYAINQEYAHEIETLQKVSEKSIAGVITTNYDTFLEDHFVGFKKYIGQGELIFSRLQGIGEIYKIHGSVEDPESIVINEDDYNQFNSKSAYLAAKLMTIFVEYPIIFLGYSLSDQNVLNIIDSIVKCLNPEQIKTLERRFVFVDYCKEALTPEISSFSMLVNGKNLPMTKITLSDFIPLYEAIGAKKSKLPVRILRKFKEELYTYIVTNSPTATLRVAFLEDERVPDDDMVLAIGRADQFAVHGLSGISRNAWFRNVVMDDIKFSADELLEYAFPQIVAAGGNKIPLHKYLNGATKQFSKAEKYAKKHTFDNIVSDSIKKHRKILGELKSIDDILAEYGDDIQKTTSLIAYLREDSIDVSKLKEFLVGIFTDNPDILDTDDSVTNGNIRRLIRIYDYLVWGKGRRHAY